MSKKDHKRYLISSTMLGVVGLLYTPVLAQEAAPSETIIEEIVVTGSRIKRSKASTAAPVNTIGAQDFLDRGYVSAADALNQNPSLSPQLNQTDGSGSGSGSGQQYPDLFGLGAGRTLTLVNGRRYVTSSSGLEEARVDANIIPTGLIDRIEIVQAGGAAVYGSDAIAGVVNYILKDDFEGLELDAQTGLSDQGDYWQKSLRATYGINFDEDRGNIAVNVEWSSTPFLRSTARERSSDGHYTIANPDDTGIDDGIPSDIELFDRTFWNFNQNGVIYNFPAPPSFALTQLDGSAIQFSPDGSIIPYDTGNITGIPFASGGDGVPYSNLEGLRTGVDRFVTNVIGHYDVTDRIRVSTELLYARTVGTELSQGETATVLGSGSSGAIAFTRNNPFLTSDAIASLSSASAGFAAGAPLFLSKSFYTDLFENEFTETKTQTFRAQLGAEGDFDSGDRNFYWTVSGSYAKVKGSISGMGVNSQAFLNAVDAVSDGAGGAACAINMDADTTNDDPACVAFNPFGEGASSQAARDYVTIATGQDYSNEQIDFLATIGTSLFTLPGGEVQTVLSYEHRKETAEYTPSSANQLGLVGTGTKQVATAGGYNTDEFAAEILIPLIGEDFTLPFAQLVELSATYRHVDNSIAGTEGVWSAGLRWVVSDDLTLRGTRSRNFRAPTITQLFAPQNTSLTQIGGADPCDFRSIDEGPNPTVRRANCEAEWAANSGYADLATYQNSSTNFTTATVATGGNANLENEVSKTWSYGFVLEPSIIPGLTISLDRIEINMKNALSSFVTADFAAVCYDSTTQPTEFCSAFTRLAAGDGTSDGGSIISGKTTYVNAGAVIFRGEVFYMNYDMSVGSLFQENEEAQLSLTVNLTHTSKYSTSVTGFDLARTDNTVTNPDWVGRFDASYAAGPLRLTYQLYYMSSVKASENASIENTLYPTIGSNITHSISGQYDISDAVTFRAGITNLTNKAPSYPTATYGDIIGRRFYVGATARF